MKPIAKLFASAITFAAISVAAQAQEPKGKVLVILSSETVLPLKDGKTFTTGYYLNELMIPAERFSDAGYELVFANPKGNAPEVDQASVSADYFGGSKEELEKAKRLQRTLSGLGHPLALSAVSASDLAQYKAVFVPGGPAPMIDLMADPDLGTILRYFHEHKKTTVLLCHGPIALLSATRNPRATQAALRSGNNEQSRKLTVAWPYADYRMTVFSNEEEDQAAKNVFHAEPLFRPEDALELAGGKVGTVSAWHSKAIKDRELITGQNPFSDKEMMDIVLAALTTDAAQSQK